MMRFWLTAGAIVLLLAAPLQQAHAGSRQDWKRCPKINNPKLAIPACSRIIRRRGEGRKNTAIAYSNRCAARNNLGQHDKAITDCSKALRLNPKYALAYDNRAWAHEKKGDWDKVIADTTRALEIKQWALPYNRRGNAHDNKGEYDRAIADLLYKTGRFCPWWQKLTLRKPSDRPAGTTTRRGSGGRNRVGRCAGHV